MQINQSPDIRKIVIFSLSVIIVFIGGFVLWATLATLESASIAPGNVIVAGNRRVIQHYEGGIIEKIFVHDGSFVKQDALLMKLKDTSAKVTSSINQNEYWTLIGTQARIHAELNHKKINFPKQMLISDTPEIKAVVKLQTDLLEANKQHFKSTVGVYKQRVEQLQHEVAGTKAVIKANKEQREFIEKELKDAKILVEKRLIKQSRYYALQREFSGITGKKGELEAKVAEIKQKIGETKLQIISIKDKHHKALLDELHETQKKLHEMKQRGITSSDILTRTEIRAPISGTVVNLKFHTIGGVIRNGEPIMDIVPKHESLIIEAKLNPLDIDNVYPGLHAKVTLTGLSQRNTPKLLGVVTHVSADAIMDQNTKSPYFKIKIRIFSNELKKLVNKELYPGMPAEAMIITHKTSPWVYFTKPIIRSFNRAFHEH